MRKINNLHSTDKREGERGGGRGTGVHVDTYVRKELSGYCTKAINSIINKLWVNAHPILPTQLQPNLDLIEVFPSMHTTRGKGERGRQWKEREREREREREETATHRSHHHSGSCWIRKQIENNHQKMTNTRGSSITVDRRHLL